ncbi:hypothetical protein Bbelb_085420 [Branchiostoma belcheri]|nr:hypothetical protein Bbelb_085420 [Branchiostoma belcheri]
MCAKVITNQGKDQEKLTEKHRRLWIFAISRGDTATEISRDCGELLSPKSLGKLHPPGSDTMLPGSLIKKNLGRKKYRDWDESKEQKEGRGPKGHENATSGPRNSREVPALPFESTFWQRNSPSVGGFLKLLGLTPVLAAAGMGAFVFKKSNL